MGGEAFSKRNREGKGFQTGTEWVLYLRNRNESHVAGAGEQGVEACWGTGGRDRWQAPRPRACSPYDLVKKQREYIGSVHAGSRQGGI